MNPRGRFVSGGGGGKKKKGEEKNSHSYTNGNAISGPVSAYLQYSTCLISTATRLTWGVGWNMKLINGVKDTSLHIATSGGLPKSADAWSSATTFCTDIEAIESSGRASDGGSSTWFARDVVATFLQGDVRAEGGMIEEREP